MGFYDEYGDMRELNDFYSAIEDAFNGIGLPKTCVEKSYQQIPFPNESSPNLDILIDESKMPF